MDFFTYEQAKKNVKAKKKLYKHFMIWLIVSIFLIILNLITNDHHFWAIFPILGWGVALAFHSLEVFSNNLSNDWEEKEIEKEMQKMIRRQEKEKMYKKEHANLKTDPRESDFV